MKTLFASPERKSGPPLLDDIRFAGENPLILTLLRSVPGLLAVLNEERQLLAMNEDFFRSLGFGESSDILGLRLGEVVRCVHAYETEGGCGTGRYCSSCGAAIAMVSALAGEGPVERKCVIEKKHGVRSRDLHLAVRADQFKWEDSRFILLFVRDIGEQERRISLERAFFHDVRNIIMALDGLIDTHEWKRNEETGSFKWKLESLIDRLKTEVEIQRTLSAEENWEIRPKFNSVTVRDVMGDLERAVRTHPASGKAKLALSADDSPIPFRTDRHILVKVLGNLVLNAFEAEEGGEVRVWNERSDSNVVFKVWNAGSIDERVALRIFHKHFSTKKGQGRGFGTYSAKFFSEEILGGHIGFESTEEGGTVFRLELPVYGC